MSQGSGALHNSERYCIIRVHHIKKSTQSQLSMPCYILTFDQSLSNCTFNITFGSKLLLRLVLFCCIEVVMHCLFVVVVVDKLVFFWHYLFIAHIKCFNANASDWSEVMWPEISFTKQQLTRTMSCICWHFLLIASVLPHCYSNFPQTLRNCGIQPSSENDVVVT